MPTLTPFPQMASSTQGPALLAQRQRKPCRPVPGEEDGGGSGRRAAPELTLGMLSLVQTPSDSNLSRISQAKMDGHSRLYWAILLTTSGVATLGLLPPMALGRMEPVS